MERSPSDANAATGWPTTEYADIGVRVADAESIADSFSDDRADHFLHPIVTVELDSDLAGDHLFIFMLAIDLDEDFAPADYPRDGVEELKADLRDRLLRSSVGRTQSIVRVMTHASAARK